MDTSKGLWPNLVTIILFYCIHLIINNNNNDFVDDLNEDEVEGVLPDFAEAFLSFTLICRTL